MFKDAAKGLCKQQSQDSASENITVNTTTKLEQVTACSVLKFSLVLRSGNCKLNEAEDNSMFLPHHTAISFPLHKPCHLDHSLQSFLCKLNSCSLPAPGGRSGAVARAQSPSNSIHGSQMGGTTVGTAQTECLSQTSSYKRNTTWETEKNKKKRSKEYQVAK